jgi:hypothetical protein
MNITKSQSPVGTTRQIAAFFPTRVAAEKAKAEIVQNGVSPEAVKVTDAHGTMTGNAAAAPREGTGLVATLKNAFAQDQPEHSAQKHPHGVVVTAHVPEQHFEHVREVLGREGRLTDV